MSRCYDRAIGSPRRASRRRCISAPRLACMPKAERFFGRAQQCGVGGGWDARSNREKLKAHVDGEQTGCTQEAARNDKPSPHLGGTIAL